MLSPKKVKWRRQHRLGYKGNATRGAEISFGDYAICCTESGRITARQIEASRIAISRSVKRGGKLWIRLFPDRSVTKKPAETRMGKGKGSPDYWESVVRAGKILFEINGVTREQAEAAFTLAAHKLPLKTKFMARE